MKKRNQTIDLFKFIFAIVIVLHHSNLFYVIEKTNLNIATAGYLAVEFFFIVSGYLFAKKVISKEHDNVFVENLIQVKDRYLKIFPFLFLSVVTGLALTFLGKEVIVDTVIYDSLRSLSDLFLLQMLGFDGFWATGVTWYLSALIISTFVFYPLLAKYKEITIKYLMPILVLLIYGFFFKKGGTINGPCELYGFVYKGLLRGFAGVSLGCIAYEIVEFINNKEFIKSQSMTATITMIVCYIGSIFYMLTDFHLYSYEAFVVALLFIAIVISFTKLNLLNNILSTRFCGFLGAFSLSVYLNHHFVSSNILRLCPSCSPNRTLFYYLVIVFILSTLNYIFGRLMLKGRN